jgi:hypothetical protein
MPRHLMTLLDSAEGNDTDADAEADGDFFVDILLCPRADPRELKSSRSKGLPLLSTVGHLITLSFRGGSCRPRDCSSPSDLLYPPLLVTFVDAYMSFLLDDAAAPAPIEASDVVLSTWWMRLYSRVTSLRTSGSCNAFLLVNRKDRALGTLVVAVGLRSGCCSVVLPLI